MEKLKTDIENSKRILITSHVDCDQDGITSALATKLIIEKNLKDKEVEVNIPSELQKDISFLKGFSQIQNQDLLESLEKFNPNMLIFVDGQTQERFSPKFDKIQEFIEQKNIVTVLIDHHDSETAIKTKHFSNNLRSSCAEEIYDVFIRKMGYKIDKDIAEIILTGMIYDTGIFTYKNNHFRDTVNIVADLVEYGAVIEKILNHKNNYKIADMDIIAELSQNIKIKNDFCYTYISDNFYQNNIKKTMLSQDEFKRARHNWMNIFLKSIENCNWGFVVYQTPEQGKYKVTTRSKQGSKIVREFAELFNGGGHDHAAGFTICANNIQTAINKILPKI